MEAISRRDALPTLAALNSKMTSFFSSIASGRESRLRSILKTITYRIGGTTVTALLALAYTRRWGWALGIGGADAAAKLVLFYLHERLWDRIDYGLNPGASGEP